VQGLLQTLRGLGAVRLGAMGAVAIGLVAFFIFLSAKLGAPDHALLFADLDPGDSNKIVGKLETMNIPYELQAGGRQIMVPSDKVLRLRMQLAEDGLPSGGSIGYELFDRSEALGTTNFVQNINHVRALEGELSRTIRSIAAVQEARVHLVLPKRELFSRKEREPSGSVFIRAKGAERLTKTQVKAIQHLVASAVPGLAPTRVSIVDSRGQLLARGTGEGEGGIGAPDGNEDMRRAHETRLARVIEELLEQSVGVGKVRAEVTAEMDFDRITTSQETYDPDGQVVRSTQSVEESGGNSDTRGRPAVTVRNNLPEGQAGAAGSPQDRSESNTSRNEETVNYEISKTVRSHVREVGTVRKLSVAVLVDGKYAQGADGKYAYQPRTKEELDALTKLVRSAIGYDEKRGDTLELANMQFVTVPAELEPVEQPLFGLSKADYFRIAELLVLAVVAILVILLVVRPLVNRTLDALPSALSRDQERNLIADQSADTPALTGPAGVGDGKDDEMIDVAQIEGKVKASIIKKIGEIVEHHPEETVSIIREWLYQDA
jgi:flagellar M-ring protein FliF